MTDGVPAAPTGPVIARFDSRKSRLIEISTESALQIIAMPTADRARCTTDGFSG